MKKIPTLFERDWEGDRSRVLPQVHAGCEWVIAGEGVATRKLDGTCCLIRSEKLYKRRELRKGETEPPLFERVDLDEETGKTVGWMPVGPGSEDRWHREAFVGKGTWPDGTYELVGPKVQGNPEESSSHHLIRHGYGMAGEIVGGTGVPRTFDELKEWMATKNIEGVVFHHPDGRMVKIKLRDFSLKRRKAA